MTSAALSEQLPKSPHDVLAYAKRLYAKRPEGSGRADTPKGRQTQPRPDRRVWGSRLAQAIEALSNIPVTNERLRGMMSDAPDVLELVLKCRSRRHTQART